MHDSLDTVDVIRYELREPEGICVHCAGPIRHSTEGYWFHAPTSATWRLCPADSTLATPVRAAA